MDPARNCTAVGLGPRVRHVEMQVADARAARTFQTPLKDVRLMAWTRLCEEPE